MPPLTPSGTAEHLEHTESFPALLLLALMLTVAVYVELKERRIPNWLNLSGMALGLFIGYLDGSAAFWSSLGGLAIGFGFLFVFYVFGGVGGGDVKLMGAAGSLMGVSLIMPALFYTSFIGVVLAVMMIVWRQDFWMRVVWGVKRMAFWRKNSSGAPPGSTPIAVPYGVAIALGCLLALLTGSVR
jgi:prepilin peptidase CpaA